MNLSISDRRGVQHHLLVLIAACMLTVLASPARAALDIPNVPLQSGTAVPPNIMFIIDDSGSMHWEIMPDEARGGTSYIFPRIVDGIYGGNDYANVVFAFTEAHNANVIRRSSTGNTTFYDPAVDYVPWVDSTGEPYANIDPTAAPYNPHVPGLAQLDLTVRQSLHATWRSGGTNSDGVQDFWPMTFYVYRGTGDQGQRANYVRFQYRNGTWYRWALNQNATTEASVTSLDWSLLGGPVRTPAQERQNFANWFSYYRSRILASRAGIGRAFAQLPQPTLETPAPRVGYGAINKGRSDVDGSNVHAVIRGVRPFAGSDREAFFDLLYGRTIPQANTPLRRALDAAGLYYSSNDERGPWSDTPGEDGGGELSCRAAFTILMTDGYWNGPNVTGGGEQDNDSTAGTEIQGPNNPPYTYQPRQPFADNRANTLADVAMHYWKRDLRTDLPNRVPTTAQNPAFWQHMVTYGVGLGVTGSVDPDEAFEAIETGATINWGNPTTNAGKIDDLLHAAVNSRGGFFSAQNPVEFANELLGVLTSIIERTSSASNVTTNSTSLDDGSRIYQASYLAGQWSGELFAYPVTAAGVSPTPAWRASNVVTAGSWNDRRIFTNAATGAGAQGAGALFRWDALSATQRDALARGQGAGHGQAVLEYLRGRQVNERQFGGPLGFRDRTRILGDVIHSSPVLLRETGADAHTTLFVGANDGQLHAFDAEDGSYRFGFVPRHIDWDALATLSDSNYSHRYFVDGDITVSTRTQTLDRNILVGSLGRGGKGLYALDVTSPSEFDTTDVLWEFVDPDLGHVIGKPIIARLRDGTMAVIVGNGPNSASDRAFLFIIGLEDGELIRKIDTTAGSDTQANGLSTPRGWDVDANGRIDLVYAGDLLGNLWKFDLSANNANNWDVAFRQGQDRHPLFVARDGAGNRQPITGGVSIALDPESYRRWVFFGTGRYLTTDDPGDRSVQSWYGVIDDGERITGNRTTELLERSIAVEEVVDGRRLRAFEEGDTTQLLDKRGWFVDLVPPGGTPAGERIVSDSLIFGRVLLSASIIPTDDPCDVGGSGFINAIDAFSGASLRVPFFDIDGDGNFDENDLIGDPGSAAGSVDLGVGMPTLPAIIRELLVGGGSSGQTGSIGINDPTDVGRISWREIVRD